jgi:hypothetical protein
MQALTDDDVATLKEVAQLFRDSGQAEAPREDLGNAANAMCDAKVMAGPRIGQEPMMKPRLGETVVYRARTRGYLLPAIVTANADTLDMRGLIRGDVPALTGEEHVHLHVLSCGAMTAYQEHNVPYSREERPGTWGWR